MAINPPPAAAGLLPVDHQAQWNELKTHPIVAIPVNIANKTSVIVEGTGILIGWAFRETAAQATTLDFLDGRDATGNQLGSDAVAASGSTKQSVGVSGALFKGGLSLTVGAGTVKGAVWVQI